MAGDITQWQPGESRGLSRWNPQQRELDREAQTITNKARLDAHEVNARAAVAYTSMDRVADVDGVRRSIAGNDELLNSALIPIEMAFISFAQRKARGL